MANEKENRSRLRANRPPEGAMADGSAEKRQKISDTGYIARTATQLDDESCEPPTLVVKGTQKKGHRILKPRNSRPSTANPRQVSEEVPEAQSIIDSIIDSHFLSSQTVKTEGNLDDGTATPSSGPTDGKKKRAPRKKLAPKVPAKIGEPETEPSQADATISKRPLPQGQPPVWSDSRQHACAALPPWKAYQSAAYCSKGLCHGFLVDGNGGLRSYMDSEIVITKAGGGCAMNEEGVMVQAKDHASDNSEIRALKKNLKEFVPIYMLVGEKNEYCPVKVPHAYNVLDFFVVSKIWAEKELVEVKKGLSKDVYKTVFKYRFEKLDLLIPSWWTPENSNETCPIISSPVKAPSEMCTACNTISTQIYDQGWTCCNELCGEFHSIVTRETNDKLTYSRAFLKERRTITRLVKPAYPLVPPPPSDEDMGTDATECYSRGNWKGFVCPECRACNSKRFFDRWECLQKDCDYVNRTKMPLLTWKNLLGDNSDCVYGHALPLDYGDEAHVTESWYLDGNWRITTYKFTDEDYVTHFQANKFINAALNSSNELLEAFQLENLGLERFPRSQGTLCGEFLSNNFIKNFGLPYKYKVAVEGDDFSQAPKPILTALHRLKWAGNKAVPSGNCKEFNEILAVGYLEAGEMKYHDDGEQDLGPTVASISFGSPAEMTFRMKAKYYNGLSGKAAYNPNAPIPNGAWCKKEREDFNTKYKDLFNEKSSASKEKFKAEVQAFYRTLPKKPGNCPAVIDLKLAHGDMVVQHGYGLQKFYEHQVVNSGKLRIAATARHIDPNCANAQGLLWKADYDTSSIPFYDGTEAETC